MDCKPSQHQLSPLVPPKSVGGTTGTSAASLMRQLCSELKKAKTPLNNYNNNNESKNMAAAKAVEIASLSSPPLAPLDHLEQRIAALEAASKAMRAFGTETAVAATTSTTIHNTNNMNFSAPQQQSERQQQQHGGDGAGGEDKGGKKTERWTYAEALAARLQSLEARIEHGVQRPLQQHLCAGRVVTLTAPVAGHGGGGGGHYVSGEDHCRAVGNVNACKSDDDDDYYKHRIVWPSSSSSYPSSSINKEKGDHCTGQSSVLVVLSRAYVDRIQAAMDVAIAGDVIIVRAPPIIHDHHHHEDRIVNDTQTTTRTISSPSTTAAANVVAGGLVLAHPLRFPVEGVRVVSGAPLSTAMPTADDRSGVHCVDYQQSYLRTRMLTALEVEGGGVNAGGQQGSFSWLGPEADRLGTAAAAIEAQHQQKEEEEKKHKPKEEVGVSSSHHHQSYMHALLQTWWGLRSSNNNTSSSTAAENTAVATKRRISLNDRRNVPIVVFNSSSSTDEATTTNTRRTSPSGLVGFVIAQASHDAPAVLIYAETAAAATVAVHLVDCLVISSNSHAIHILQKQQQQQQHEEPPKNNTSPVNSSAHRNVNSASSSCSSSIWIDGCLLHSRYGHGVACGGLLMMSPSGNNRENLQSHYPATTPQGSPGTLASSSPFSSSSSSVIQVRIQNTTAVACGDCGFFVAAPAAAASKATPPSASIPIVAEEVLRETVRQQQPPALLEVHLHRCRVIESGADGIHFADEQQKPPHLGPAATLTTVANKFNNADRTTTSTATQAAAGCGGANPKGGRSRSKSPRHMRRFGKPNHHKKTNHIEVQENEEEGAAVTAAAVEHAVTECMIEGAARCGIYVGAHRHLAALALTTVRIQTAEAKTKAKATRNIHQKGDHGNGADADVATTTTTATLNAAARTGSSSSIAVAPVGVGVYVHETATIQEGGREAVLIAYD